MNDTIILTYIYSETPQTIHMLKSCERLNLPVHNANPVKRLFTGNGDAINILYKALLELKDKYKYVIYSDGGDTFFVRSFKPPDNIVIYSGEKACWPIEAYAAEYPPALTPWHFLNAGNWCGEIALVIEFFERYGLSGLRGDINGQQQITEAFLKALKDGFPITIDEACQYFQSVAFEHKGDFRMEGKQLHNLVTDTYPAVLHGNGRTDMQWIYDVYK